MNGPAERPQFCFELPVGGIPALAASLYRLGEPSGAALGLGSGRVGLRLFRPGAFLFRPLGLGRSLGRDGAAVCVRRVEAARLAVASSVAHVFRRLGF